MATNGACSPISKGREPNPEPFSFIFTETVSIRNLFVIYEVWRDVGALREHFEKPYVKQFVVDSAEYIEGDMEVQWMIMASGYVVGRP
jgi:Antibiotic biosynthesis monooxygenase